jgi:hypothetical protein
LIVPLSQVTMNFLNFIAQLLVLFAVIAYFELKGRKLRSAQRFLLFLPSCSRWRS